MEARKKHWGFEQWAAYFESKKLPVMPKSKQALQALEEEKGERLGFSDLVPIVLDDPLLCLRVLREAESKRTTRLGTETTTALAAMMQLGLTGFRQLLLASESIDENHHGLVQVEQRSAYASRIALRWAAQRSDLNPAEVALAALLSDTGELLLWVYEPELPQAALDELHCGRAKRSAQAQNQACGFDFKQLTLRCCEIWNLPSLLRQLLRGADNERAQLTRICSNLARHICHPDAHTNLAILADVMEARTLLPHCSAEHLISGLPGINAEQQHLLIQQAHANSSENAHAFNDSTLLRAKSQSLG